MTEAASPTRKYLKSGHTRPRAPTLSLDQPGRLRVAHLLCLFSVSHATFYKRLKKGLYPAPDGRDGKMPFWSTQTIREFLSLPRDTQGGQP